MGLSGTGGDERNHGEMLIVGFWVTELAALAEGRHYVDSLCDIGEYTRTS